MTLRTGIMLMMTAAASLASGQEKSGNAGTSNGTPALYSFSMKTIDGDQKALKEYQGKVVLVVNVASKCGYTKQYAGLEKLYDTYKDKGLVILGFPANNFLWQEPGSDADIKAFCSTTYQVSFDMFSKISVKGDDIHPLYRYLTEQSPVPGAVKWNFQKYLIDRNGNVVTKFAPAVEPLSDELVSQVEALLKKQG